MKERKQLVQFKLEAEIYSIDLDQKIWDLIKNSCISPAANKVLECEVAFSKSVYSDPKFYQYPLSEKTLKLSRNATNRLSQKEMIGHVFGEQIDKITSKMEENGIYLQVSSIIGKEMEQHYILITFLESEKEKTRTKKSATNYKVRNVMPDFEYIQEQYTQFMVEFIKKKWQEMDHKSFAIEEKLLQPVSSMLFFDAIANAISAGATITGEYLLKQAHIETEWPLVIRSKSKYDMITEIGDTIYCPPMVAFAYYKDSSWKISQVADKKEAKAFITYNFSHSHASEVVILNDLKVVPYSLFCTSEEGIEAISKADASKHKGLLVSWLN